MSAISALKGYRTQFLYSLYYIVSHSANDYRFRLEGEEDLDILDKQGDLLFAIQVKNLTKTVSLSEILAEQKTSFLKRFLNKYSTAIPMLVSFGSIASELKNWNSHKDTISSSEKGIIKKYQLTEPQWQLIKTKTEFIEVNEENVIEEILDLLKIQYPFIAPIPTAEYLLYWLQVTAERQISITTAELFSKIEEFGLYLTQRNAIAEQYGLVLKPMHKTSLNNVNIDILKEEFYYGTNTRYEHILLNIDVQREKFLEQIQKFYTQTNVVIIKGASGQGKSTLAYRYAYEYAPDTLLYELDVQQDFIATQKSIQAISSIAQNLNTPVLFLVHVTTNTTEWVKIVKESNHHNFVRFLITIRNEDWFKATATGINFLHNEVELSLSKTEAEIIFNHLNQKKQVLHYADFEEAWIKIGTDVPMLEFIYSITQGDSLRNRLQQQVRQIESEDNYNNNVKQSELLRLVSLADFFGARIDVSKINKHANLQFTIERFEKEYLIKKSGDKKYISGLHFVRSEILTNILFDEFINAKKEYALKCLSVIADEDVYTFLLQGFAKSIMHPNNIIDKLNQQFSLSWPFYNGIQKSLIWFGVKDYINSNKSTLDECYNNYGDAWIMMMNIYHAGTLNTQNLLESLSLGDKIKNAANDFNSKLSDLGDVYKYATLLFDKVKLPSSEPFSSLDWSSFGQLLFWLKQIPNKAEAVIPIPENKFEEAFLSIEIESLSKLMLGMFHYSEYFNSIRIKLAPHFIKRLQERFKIAHILFEDEISVHFIVDVQNANNESSFHNLVLDIIDLLRDAYPDKQKFNTQGHGHRLQMIPLLYDETEKGISKANLPLDEWVSINATTNKLFEFSKRPKDWHEYHEILDAWEDKINRLITEFNTAFESYFQNKNDNDYRALIPILPNAEFSDSGSIKEPQCITDPLGIYFDTKKKPDKPGENNSVSLLKTKYEKFFKSQRDFKTAIENFILQSGKTLLSRMDKIINPESEANNDFEHLSQTNLFDAVQKHLIYSEQKIAAFKNLELVNPSQINTNALLTTATLWKDFLNGNKKKVINGSRNYSRIYQLRYAFEARIAKGCKIASKNINFNIKYINNGSTNHKPILLINSTNPALSVWGFKDAYNVVKEAVACPDYTSLKYLMLQTWFSHFYIIQLTDGNTINGQWNQVPLYLFKEKTFDELAIYNAVPKTIDATIAKNLTIKNWNEIYPKIDEIQKLSEAFMKMRALAEHLHDLKYFEGIEMNETGMSIFNDHVKTTGNELQKSFQNVLDAFTDLLDLFPFDENKLESDELEQEYWRTFIAIKDSIFPTITSIVVNELMENIHSNQG
jgi:hypothetical protein